MESFSIVAGIEKGLRFYLLSGFVICFARNRKMYFISDIEKYFARMLIKVSLKLN